MYKIKDFFLSLIRTRVIFLLLVYLAFAVILIIRCFKLQIVEGENYQNNFNLSIKKERSVEAARGNIYDCNGVLLAYNELAYSITVKDAFDSGSNKNLIFNNTLKKVIEIIEQNGDSVDISFNIILNEDGEYAFTVSGTRLNRFKADIYGRAYVNDMTYAESSSTAQDIMDFLTSKKKFNVDTENLSKDMILKIVAIRYNVSLNAYQKYIETTIASNVSSLTVASIFENSDILNGISVKEDTKRVYPTGKYTSQIIGYTGIISSDEYSEYYENDKSYTYNDIVGKIGIEKSMEASLRGQNGSETVYVDTLGRIISRENYKESTAGRDIYLTIDSKMQEGLYKIIEQHLAGILLKKLTNTKEVDTSSGSSSDILIPVYDVYYQLINNNILNVNHFKAEDASDNEKAVYEAYINKKETVIATLVNELTEKKTVYKKLSTEYKNYENLVEDILINAKILDTSKIDYSDATLQNWANYETISLSEYIKYAISKSWVNMDSLDISKEYSESNEIFNAIVEYLKTELNSNSEFDRILYRYIIKSDKIKPKVICNCLIDQNIVELSTDEMSKWEKGKITPFEFIKNRIYNLDLTPAQLALDPCTASVVITDVKTGDVKALVSYPSYDNNYLANGASASYLRKVNSDLSKPLINYATMQRTAPGSTYKMVTATAGLEEGIIKTNTLISCLGQFTEITDIHNCWIYPRKHGALNVSGAIKNSCNYFFYTVGYKLSIDKNGKYNSDQGIERLNYYAGIYGLSEKSGIEIEEYSPILSNAYSVPSAIGQGSNSFTTVGLARYITAVANSGTVFDLTLIDKTTDSNGNLLEENHATVRNTIELNKKYWDAIHLGMKQVVESKSYFQNYEIDVAGKTGTAQQSKTRANHGLFVCYAPYNNPEVAVACRIANGYSSDYAAETSKDVLSYYLNLYDEEELITGTAIETAISRVTGD